MVARDADGPFRTRSSGLSADGNIQRAAMRSGWISRYFVPPLCDKIHKVAAPGATRILGAGE
jgi:hypothetical protein